jgi:hypothetical protein
MMLRDLVRLMVVLAAALSAAGASPPSSENSIVVRTFWAGIDYLGVIFKAVGSLGGGADQGQVWVVDLVTGERRQISNADGLAWPVLDTDQSTIFALRGRQLVRLKVHGGETVSVGPQANWRKLVGVNATGDVLGFLAGPAGVQPVLLTSKGELLTLPKLETEEEQVRVSRLLQENRAYQNGRELIVTRSARGGRGYDVNLITGDLARNLSDCGDNACGQPSLSPDGRYVLYIRAETR